jgi:hypothetical protein
MLGFDLASANKRMISDLTLDRDKLQAKLNELKLDVHDFETGQDREVPCEDRPGLPGSHWEERIAQLGHSFCGDRRYYIESRLPNDIGGRKCGFHRYAVVCTNLGK